MSTVLLETDYWIETADPIVNLQTESWGFELGVLPGLTVQTEQWNFALTPHPTTLLKTNLYVPFFYSFSNGPLYSQNIFMVASDIAGDVQMLNVGKSDDSAPIFFELETQELEFNNRAIIKAVLDKLGIASQYADESKIQIIADEGNPTTIKMSMGKRINIITLPNLKGHYITLRWSGVVNEKSPVLEGFYLNKVIDQGING